MRASNVLHAVMDVWYFSWNSVAMQPGMVIVALYGPRCVTISACVCLSTIDFPETEMVYGAITQEGRYELKNSAKQ